VKTLCQHSQSPFQFAVADPLLKAAMAGLKWWILVGKFTPLRSGAQHPQYTIQYGSGVVPWTAAPIGATSRTQHRLYHLPLLL